MSNTNWLLSLEHTDNGLTIDVRDGPMVVDTPEMLEKLIGLMREKFAAADSKHSHMNPERWGPVIWYDQKYTQRPGIQPLVKHDV